jgi:murein DD-endopeptidase / murein LD-carboxypeptidase
MKNNLLAFLLLLSVSYTHAQDEESNKYHYNKVYDYENDTVPAIPFRVDSLLRYADKLVGVPYKAPGGRSPAGFDCSGFTFYCFRANSIYLPYSSHDQAEIGKEVSIAEASSGDLIFFQGYDITDKGVHHVGIVVSKKGERVKFIHSSSHGGVHYEYLDSPYYRSRFIKIRRVHGD